MKFEDTQELELFNRDTGKFETVEQDVTVFHILSVFSAEEKIYLRRIEAENWLDNIACVSHLEYD